MYILKKKKKERKKQGKPNPKQLENPKNNCTGVNYAELKLQDYWIMNKKTTIKETVVLGVCCAEPVM